MTDLILYYLVLQNNLIEYKIYYKKPKELICSNEHLCLFEHIFVLSQRIVLLHSNRARAPPVYLNLPISNKFGGFFMKEYKLNDNERKVLITTIINTKRSYFSKLLRRKDIAQFESIESITDIPTYSDMEAIENQFYMDELLRIAKPYLTRKEFNVLKNAVANAENFDEFKSDLFKNRNYEYKILSRVLKKIGGLFNE